MKNTFPLTRRRHWRRTAAAVAIAAGVLAGASGAASAHSAPAAPSAPAAGNDVVGLQRGSTGNGVKAVQTYLTRHGYYLAGGVDGVYGATTERAVRHFQQASGIQATGTITPATAKLMGLSNGSGAAAAAAAPAAASSVQGLQQGASGQSVAALHAKLRALGLVVDANGTFGTRTVRAVKAVQKVNGLAQTGVVDAKTARVLGLGANAAAPAAPASATPAPAAPASSIEGLRQGASGAAVSTLQAKLRGLGLVVDADGTFGARTARAVVAVQKVNGLPQTGVVDTKTAQMLGLAPSVAPAAPGTSASVSGTSAGFATYDEQGARTVALQRALIKAGMTLRGGADGKFGSGTLAAIIEFQRARGLGVTGKVDAATAAALGLQAMPKPAEQVYAPVVLEARPVAGNCYYGDTWGASRSLGRTHLGTDIMANEGTPLQAVFTGRIVQIYRDAPGSLSGNGLKIARPDGTYAFYAHLSSFAPGIDVGVPVTAGQVVGYVGHTGNAGGPHLHFELHPGGGSAVNPYATLKTYGAC